MMKYTTLFLLIISINLFSSCVSVKDGKPGIKEGVYGQVTEVRGNQMPSPDVKPGGNGKPVTLTVQVYEVTQLKDTEGQSPLFNKINSKPIASRKTDKNGYFQIKLPPGRYSIFALIEDKDNIEAKRKQFFASMMDGNGEVSPFEVKANEVTRYDVKLTYRAAF